VYSIVKEACAVIWEILQPEQLPSPNASIWKKNADDFFSRLDFPHCIAAIDGKHIRWKAPPMSGARYFNYKGYHSVVLLAAVDAHGRFVVDEVGAYGSNSDGGVLQDCSFGKLLASNNMDLPTPTCIPGTNILASYAFVGDEALPLTNNLMRPFPQRNLTDAKRVFNYLSSRARRQVECTFGIISQM